MSVLVEGAVLVDVDVEVYAVSVRVDVADGLRVDDVNNVGTCGIDIGWVRVAVPLGLVEGLRISDMMDSITFTGLAVEIVGRLDEMETVRLELVAKSPGITVKEDSAVERATDDPEISILSCVLGGKVRRVLKLGASEVAEDSGENSTVDAVIVVETPSDADSARDDVGGPFAFAETHIVVDAVAVAVSSRPNDWLTAACATKRRVDVVELEDAAETWEKVLDCASKLEDCVEIATAEELLN